VTRRRVGSLVLLAASAWSAPLGSLLAITVTGDRLLGLAALVVLVVLGVRGRLRWTSVHTALAIFVGAQLVTTAVNARAWPQGLKFVTVYVLGFSCFALAAECTRGIDGQRWMMKVWIAVAVVASVVGTVLADLSNLYQQPLWGTGAAQLLFPDTAYEHILYGAKVTFNEWNLFGSFLLIPFALGLWAWRRDGGGQWPLVAALGVMEFGLVATVTRAAWLGMAGLIALWWTLRRPRWRQVSVLAAILAAAFLLQALALGAVPLWSRIFEQRTNIAHRSAINRVTLDSWIGRPTPGQVERPPAPAPSWLLGHGAGSVNSLPPVIVPEGRILKVWTGNVVLFVLHDSGLVGLAALVGLIVVVLRRAAHTMRRGDGASALTVPLLTSGAALCFAYQFTHGLWLMYPYVYLGFLTAATETDESP